MSRQPREEEEEAPEKRVSLLPSRTDVLLFALVYLGRAVVTTVKNMIYP